LVALLLLSYGPALDMSERGTYQEWEANYKPEEPEASDFCQGGGRAPSAEEVDGAAADLEHFHANFAVTDTLPGETPQSELCSDVREVMQQSRGTLGRELSAVRKPGAPSHAATSPHIPRCPDRITLNPKP
jgi:hypothetical protein